MRIKERWQSRGARKISRLSNGSAFSNISSMPAPDETYAVSDVISSTASFCDMAPTKVTTELHWSRPAASVEAEMSVLLPERSNRGSQP